jgi:hypothetical protein
VRHEADPRQVAGGDRSGGWCVWRWPGGVPPQAGRRSGGLRGPGRRRTAPQGRRSGPVAGGMARGCRGPHSIARRSTPGQAASVRGPSNHVLSEVLRAGRASTAGLSPLSTPDSILMCCVNFGSAPSPRRCWGKVAPARIRSLSQGSGDHSRACPEAC